MANNLRRKIGVFGGRIFIVALPFRNGLEYRNGDGQSSQRFSVDVLSPVVARAQCTHLEICYNGPSHGPQK